MGEPKKDTGKKAIVILAAGRGSRLKKDGRPKPLTKFLGVPLIERAIRAFYACGAREFYVVTGYRHRDVESFLKKVAQRLGDDVSITTVFNDRWEGGNGTSFLKGASSQKRDFVLAMCDHVFSRDLMVHALRYEPPPGGMALFVDTRVDNPIIDKEDATKVRLQGGQVIAIGKDLDLYSGYDTGLFVCSKDVGANARPLEGARELGLSTVFQWLTDRGLTRAIEIDSGFWADLDDLNAFKRAEKALFMLLRGKAHDGPVSRFLNRPLSIRLTSLLVNTPLTPNQVSIISFMLAIVASIFMTQGSYLWFALGGIMAQVASIVDGCDGEIARLKWQQSDYGAWLDAVLDRYADAFMIGGITWHVANHHALGNVGWILGTVALAGSLINSYTADKYDGWMRQRKKVPRFRLGRDVRIFLVFVSSLAYRPVELLVMLAGIMNTENVRRMWQLRTA